MDLYIRDCELKISDNEALTEALQKAESNIQPPVPWYKTNSVMVVGGVFILASGVVIGRSLKK
jgi:hypothetical protein